jgi:hypothetical protein
MNTTLQEDLLAAALMGALALLERAAKEKGFLPA